MDLIARINIREKDVRISTETTSWKALREAETLTDPAAFPLLREIVEENAGKAKEKRETRRAAYFIYGRLVEKGYTPEDCAFFLRRLEAEVDKDLLCSMLDRIKDWQQRKGILLPPELDTSPVCQLARNDQWRVRQSALHALSACPGEASREVLGHWLTQEDEKLYKYEIWYACISMQTIGEPEDIPLLERFVGSRRQDLKITSRCAIQYINERAKKARGEVST